MYTTVLIENAILLMVCGYAFHEHRKAPYLMLIVANVLYMAFDNALIVTLDIETVNQDHTIYYMAISLYFLIWFMLFGLRLTKINLIFAGCMLTQAFMSFIMAVNGATLNSARLPEYDIVYDIQRLTSSLVWVVEILTVLNVEILKTWNAKTTKSKL